MHSCFKRNRMKSVKYEEAPDLFVVSEGIHQGGSLFVYEIHKFVESRSVQLHNGSKQLSDFTARLQIGNRVALIHQLLNTTDLLIQFLFLWHRQACKPNIGE